MGIAQFGAFSGKDQIAGHHHFEPSCHGKPVHSGNHGFGAVAHQAEGMIDQIEQVRLAGFMIGTGDFLEIRTGTERPPRSGQNDGADCVVGHRVLQGGGHLMQHLHGHGVHLVSPLEGDPFGSGHTFDG